MSLSVGIENSLNSVLKGSKKDSIHNLLTLNNFEIPRVVSWVWTSSEAENKGRLFTDSLLIDRSNMLSLRHLWKQRKRSGLERCRFHFRAIMNRDDNGSYGNGWACPGRVGKVRTDKSHRANPGDVNIEVSIFRKRCQGRKQRKAEKSEGSL